MVTFKQFKDLFDLSNDQLTEEKLAEIFGWSKNDQQAKAQKVKGTLASIKARRKRELELVKQAGGLNAWAGQQQPSSVKQTDKHGTRRASDFDYAARGMRETWGQDVKQQISNKPSLIHSRSKIFQDWRKKVNDKHGEVQFYTDHDLGPNNSHARKNGKVVGAWHPEGGVVYTEPLNSGQRFTDKVKEDFKPTAPKEDLGKMTDRELATHFINVVTHFQGPEDAYDKSSIKHFAELAANKHGLNSNYYWNKIKDHLE